MTDQHSINFEDLVKLFYEHDDTAHIRRILEERFSESNTSEPDASFSSDDIRQSLTALLDFYALVEVAATCAYVPAVLPVAFRVRALGHLNLPEINTFAAESYGSVLIPRLRERLMTGQGSRLAENADSVTRCVVHFLSLVSRMRDDEGIRVFEILASGRIYEGVSFDTFLRALSSPAALMHEGQPSGYPSRVAQLATTGLLNLLALVAQIRGLLDEATEIPILADTFASFFAIRIRGPLEDLISAIRLCVEAIISWNHTDQRRSEGDRLSEDKSISSLRLTLEICRDVLQMLEQHKTIVDVASPSTRALATTPVTKRGEDNKVLILVGGVISTGEKGIIAASLGQLFESRGKSVQFVKLDPYMNVDPGTMSPFQHGEVFVTDDGSECDMALGHYERFTRCRLTGANSLTLGRIYETVIQRERRGDYLGKTVQLIPHVTNEIKGAIRRMSTESDIVIVEIGGTVGDLESAAFFEAARQMRYELGGTNCAVIHLAFVPWVHSEQSLKSKPAQHSVRDLRALGLQPDFLFCRAERFLPPDLRAKLSLLCDVDEENVISVPSVDSIYEMPSALAGEDADTKIGRRLDLALLGRDLSQWLTRLDRLKRSRGTISVGLIGKYVEYEDSYRSLAEALVHAGANHHLKVEIAWLEAEGVAGYHYESQIDGYDGIIIPAGFGKRGVDGMINAARFAREHGVPLLGIGLGFQAMIIEFARNVCGLEDANSTEFDPSTSHKVIFKLRELKGIDELGGTMRLGAWPCALRTDSRAHAAYATSLISERHRHRYEFNREYAGPLEASGLQFSGRTPDEAYFEICELPSHPWYLGCLFQPEFKSRFLEPHPLMTAFIGACEKYRNRSPERGGWSDPEVMRSHEEEFREPRPKSGRKPIG